MRIRMLKLATIVFAVALAGIGEARSTPASDVVGLLATRATEPPEIDGKLTESIWRNASPISGFTQRDPDEGKPATEITSVYVAYDDAALYIAARMEDSGPITTRLGRRDGGLESDWFRVWRSALLSTFARFETRRKNRRTATGMSSVRSTGKP